MQPQKKKKKKKRDKSRKLGPTIHIGREILCLLYAESFLRNTLFNQKSPVLAISIKGGQSEQNKKSCFQSRNSHSNNQALPLIYFISIFYSFRYLKQFLVIALNLLNLFPK